MGPAIGYPHQFANDAIPVSNGPMESLVTNTDRGDGAGRCILLRVNDAQGVRIGDMRLTSPSPDMTMALVAFSAFSTNLPSMSQ